MTPTFFLSFGDALAPRLRLAPGSGTLVMPALELPLEPGTCLPEPFLSRVLYTLAMAPVSPAIPSQVVREPGKAIRVARGLEAGYLQTALTALHELALEAYGVGSPVEWTVGGIPS